MTLTKLLVALSESDPTHPDRMARLGFLEWLGTQPDDSDPRAAAEHAVIRLNAFVANAPAVSAFRDLLVQAAAPLPPPRRRGGRPRVWH